MKRFFVLGIAAVVLTAVISLSGLAFGAFAANEVDLSESANVVYVMDSSAKIGDGSGRNAANPLWPDENKYFIESSIKTDSNDVPVYENGQPVYAAKKNYMKTALYQAAASLRDTGGTIVICGPVKIGADESFGTGSLNKDFFFPESENRIVITSVYNGVDYTKSISGATYGNAKLSLETPAHIIFNSPATMEYMKIETTTNNLGDTKYYRTICANGYDLVMGEGIQTSYTDGGSNGLMYVHLVGGSRYGDLNSDTNLTVKSGTYGTISGSIWGVSGSKYVQRGDVHLTIDGDVKSPVVVRGTLCGTSTNDVNIMVDGDVYVTISGARFGTSLGLVGYGGFYGEGHKAVLKFGENKSYNVAWFDYLPTGSVTNIAAHRAQSEAVAAEKKTGTLILDCEEASIISMEPAKYTGDKLLSRWCKGLGTNDSSVAAKWDRVIYPATWAAAIPAGHGLAVPAVVLQNSLTDTANATFDVTYTNPHTSENVSGKAATVAVVCDDSKAGSASFAYKYGNLTVVSGNTTINAAPSINLLGVRIKTEDVVQGMRFVTEVETNGVEIIEKGVLVAKSAALSTPENLTLDKTFGMITSTVADEEVFGTKLVFESEYDRTIDIGEYNTDYTARAYVKYKVGGTVYTAYSNIIERNPYEVARAAAKGEDEIDTVKDYLATNVVGKVNNFDNTTLQVSESEMEALRNKVTDYMFLQANIEWSPSQTFFIYNSTSDADLKPYRHVYEGGTIVEGVGMAGGLFEKGKTYKGMPYTSSSDPDMDTANYEAFASLIDGNGVLDIGQIKVYNEDGTLKKQITPYTGTVPKFNSLVTMSRFVNYYLKAEQKGAAYTNYTIFPGSHCSQAVFSAWNTAINNRKSVQSVNATYTLVPGRDNATMAVGPYQYVYSDYSAYNGSKTDEFNKYDETTGVGRYLSDNGPTHIRISDSLYISKYLNSAEVMYESYKALKPGDAMIQYLYNYSTSMNSDSTQAAKLKWKGSGHTRLVMSVEYNAANPGSSTVTTLECANWSVPYVKPANSGVSGSDALQTDSRSCWMERHYTFDKLIETGYIPVTIPEMRTGLQVKNNVVLTDAEFGAGTLAGTITSAKQIVSVSVKIAKGSEVVYDDTTYLIHEAMHLGKYDISNLGLGKYITAGSDYTVTITVGTPGEVVYTNNAPTGYETTQTMVASYSFAA